MSSIKEFFFILEKHSRRKTTKKRQLLINSIDKNKALVTYIQQNGFAMSLQREYNLRFVFIKQSKFSAKNKGLLFDGRFVGHEGKELFFLHRDGDILLCVTKKKLIDKYLKLDSTPITHTSLKDCLTQQFGQLRNTTESSFLSCADVAQYLSSQGLEDKVVIHLEVRPGPNKELVRYWVATETAICQVESGGTVMEVIAYTCASNLQLSFRMEIVEQSNETMHVDKVLPEFATTVYSLPKFKANKRAAMTIKLTGLNLWYRLGLVDKRFVSMVGSQIPYHYGFIHFECDTAGVPRFVTYTDYFEKNVIIKHWELPRGHKTGAHSLNKKEIEFARDFFPFLFQRQRAAAIAKCNVACGSLANGLKGLGLEKRGKLANATDGLKEFVLGLRIFVYVQSNFTMNWLRLIAFEYKNSDCYIKDVPKTLFCAHHERKFPKKDMLTSSTDRQGEVLTLTCFTIRFENCRNFLASKPTSVGENYNNSQFYQPDSLFSFSHELGCDCGEDEIPKLCISGDEGFQFDRERAFVPCQISTTSIRLHCKQRGFQRCMHLLYLITNINAYLWSNFGFDWVTSRLTSVGIVTHCCVTSAAFDNNQLYQSMEKLKPEMMEYFAKYTKGGIVETARKKLASGESIRPSFESFEPAKSLMELDIISSYASSTIQAHLPKGYCMAYFKRNQDDMLSRVDSCRSKHFEFNVFLYETKKMLDFLESIGGTMIAVFSSFGPFGLFSVSGSPVDIAYVYKTNEGKTSLLLLNAHGAFVHGCPLCYDKSASYVGGKTLEEVILKTKTRDEEIKTWVSKAECSGLYGSVAYTTRYSCHDYKSEPLNKFIRECPDTRIRRLVDAYPVASLIKPSDVIELAIRFAQTGKSSGFVVGSASIPEGLKSKTFGTIPVKLSGKTLCLSHSTGNDLTLFTFESLARMVTEHCLCLTSVESITFFSRDIDVSNIYGQLAKTRTDARLSGQSAFQGYLKRALNHSVGTMNAKQRKDKIRSSLHTTLLDVRKRSPKERIYKVIGSTENNKMVYEQKKPVCISRQRLQSPLYFSNAPVPRYHAILEHSKLTLQQIFTFLDRNLLSTKFAYLKCNTDGLLIALTENCLLDCVIPWKKTVFCEEAEELFDFDQQTSTAVWGDKIVPRPNGFFLGSYGKVKIEKCITMGDGIKNWSFYSPHSRFYAIKVEEDVEELKTNFAHKFSGVSVGSERAFTLAQNLVENENATETVQQIKTSTFSGLSMTQRYTLKHKKMWLERNPIQFGDSVPFGV